MQVLGGCLDAWELRARAGPLVHEGVHNLGRGSGCGLQLSTAYCAPSLLCGLRIHGRREHLDISVLPPLPPLPSKQEAPGGTAPRQRARAAQHLEEEQLKRWHMAKPVRITCQKFQDLPIDPTLLVGDHCLTEIKYCKK